MTPPDRASGTLRAAVRTRLEAGDRNLDLLWHRLRDERPHDAVNWGYLKRVAREWQREQAAERIEK